MIYAYTVQQPNHDWYMQTDKDSLVIVRKIYVRKIYEVPQYRLAVPLACCGHGFIFIHG